MLVSTVALVAALGLALAPDIAAPPPTTEPPPSEVTPPSDAPPATTPPSADPEATPPEVPTTTPPAGVLPLPSPEQTPTTESPVEEQAPDDGVASPQDVPAASPDPWFVNVPKRVPAAPPTGRGKLIAGAVVGGAGMIIRVITTVFVIQGVRSGTSNAAAIAVGGGFFHSPFIATALGLTGAGMAGRGQTDAYAEVFEGTPATRTRRGTLGWALFGAGLGVWTATRVGGVVGCGTQACVAAVWETGYYLSLAGTVPGVMMGGYAVGFNRYMRRYGQIADLGIAPIAHREGWGLAISGRF